MGSKMAVSYFYSYFCELIFKGYRRGRIVSRRCSYMAVKLLEGETGSDGMLEDERLKMRLDEEACGAFFALALA